MILGEVIVVRVRSMLWTGLSVPTLPAVNQGKMVRLEARV